MSADTHLFELLPDYVLDNLSPAERRLVSEHIQNCSICAAELTAYQSLAQQLALAAPEAAPSSDLKHRLMARIPTHSPRQLQLSGWQPWLTFGQRAAPAWGIVSFLLIVILVASNLLLWQRLARLETVTRSDGMRAMPLTSTGLAAGAAGFVIIGADGQNGAFIVDALPTLTPNHQYQLWLLQNEQRTSGAVFSVDEYGYGGGRIRAPQNLFEYSGCDVSIEPMGGSSAPTGEKVLAGPLK